MFRKLTRRKFVATTTAGVALASKTTNLRKRQTGEGYALRRVA